MSARRKSDVDTSRRAFLKVSLAASGALVVGVGWTGLVNTLLIEGLFGFRRVGASLSLQPNFPPAAAGLTFELRLPQDDCVIRLRVTTEARFCGEIRSRGTTECFALSRGESHQLDGAGRATEPARGAWPCR